MDLVPGEPRQSRRHQETGRATDRKPGNGGGTRRVFESGLFVYGSPDASTGCVVVGPAPTGGYH
jgi:hypothetical protein